MIRTIFRIFVLSATLVFSSCIREEALNTEADITSCTLEGDVLTGEATIKNDRVILNLKGGVDVRTLAPIFTLTPGATIVPESGSVRDFTLPQSYKVTSEDGAWSKTYTVEVTSSAYFMKRCSFEHIVYNKKEGAAGGIFQVFHDVDLTGKEFEWGSGNSGFALTGVALSYEDYPTMQATGGYEGNCLKLVTRSTGSFGAMVNMPIAAGNLFLGTFDVSTALSNSLKSTKFGLPWDQVPYAVRGRFKYRAGETFYQLDPTVHGKMKEIPGKKDQFNIVALFYEYDAETPFLDGTNYMDPQNPHVIYYGQIDPEMLIETEAWTEFEVKLQQRPGKKVDPSKLKNQMYKFAMIFTSSIHGDTFSGAPGSTLLIDEVVIDYDK